MWGSSFHFSELRRRVISPLERQHQSQPPHIRAQWQAQMWAIVESAFKSEVPALSFTFFKPATRPNIDNACVNR
jgi:hypothetical protein